MAERLRVAVLFGGRSGEHDVSLQSASSVLKALDPERFEAVPVAISRAGRWLLPRDPAAALERGIDEGDGTPVVLVGAGVGRARLVSLATPPGATDDGAGLVDAVFPVLHGPCGEDGTVQGLLELADVPYVGAGVLGSALGMDKGFMKDILRQRGLPVVEYVVVRRGDWEADPEVAALRVERALDYPCFVKPANLGSSVGISKARNRAELQEALAVAAGYDRRLVVERAVDAREIEVSVLGNDEPIASLPGEIVPSAEFYDYKAKYIDNRSQLLIPAPVSPAVVRAVKDLAVQAFLALDCAGMARVDFFLERKSGRLLVNEINTIPGFTSISMYPKLWEVSGTPYRELLTRLLELAQARWREKIRSQAAIGPAG